MTEISTTRVAEDEHGVRSSYEEIEVGKDLGALEWTVSTDDVEKQCILDDDFDEWFTVDSPYGGRIALPQVAFRPPRWLLSRNYNIRGLLYKWGMENVKVIKPGMKIVVTGCVTDKWVKNDREFVKFEAEGFDEQNELVFKTYRVHALDAIKRDAAREGKGIDSGIKKEKI